jgi:hypothetical protein
MRPEARFRRKHNPLNPANRCDLGVPFGLVDGGRRRMGK